MSGIVPEWPVDLNFVILQVWENCVHQSHPGQDYQQMQRWDIFKKKHSFGINTVRFKSIHTTIRFSFEINLIQPRNFTSDLKVLNQI